MEFTGKGRPFSDAGMDLVCSTLGVADAEVWAVLTVETRGFGYFEDRRPQILFERHKFHQITGGIYDNDNVNISNSVPGGYKGGTAEYERLEQAMELDKTAALQSTSWGIAQIMGFNCVAAGFQTVDEMVMKMVEDENAQLLAMANFIINSNLSKALQRRNWASFARGYNGKNYKRNEYDTRLAAAHAKYQTILPDLTLRAAQAALQYLGFNPGPIDGLRGRRTRSALIAFQEHNALEANGELDDNTENRLMALAYQ